MIEEMTAQIEKANIRAQKAFEITKELLKNDEVVGAVREGLEKRMRPESIAGEMSDIKAVTEGDSTPAVFEENKGAAYMLFSKIDSDFRQNPDLEGKFSDEQFKKDFIKKLPDSLAEYYVTQSSGG